MTVAGGFGHRPVGPVRRLARRAASVNATTRSIVASASGGLRSGRVASYSSQSTPSAIKRAGLTPPWRRDQHHRGGVESSRPFPWCYVCEARAKAVHDAGC